MGAAPSRINTKAEALKKAAKIKISAGGGRESQGSVKIAVRAKADRTIADEEDHKPAGGKIAVFVDLANGRCSEIAVSYSQTRTR
jgi:hypothetical protein